MNERQRHILLPGLSVQRWDHVSSIVFWVGWFLWAIMVPFWIASRLGVSWAPAVGAVLLFCGGMCVSYDNYRWSPGTAKDAEELAEGYTTKPLPHRPEVDLVDPKFGIVIRPIGAPALTMEEWKAAVKAIERDEREAATDR